MMGFSEQVGFSSDRQRLDAILAGPVPLLYPNILSHKTLSRDPGNGFAVHSQIKVTGQFKIQDLILKFFLLPLRSSETFPTGLSVVVQFEDFFRRIFSPGIIF
jgi:hypothetical protein